MKQSILSHSQSAHFQTATTLNRPTSFRQLLKYRNPTYGLVGQPVHQASEQQQSKAGHLRHSQSGLVEQKQPVEGQIQQYIKEHNSNKCANELQSSSAKLMTKMEMVVNGQSRPVSCSKLEQTLLQKGDTTLAYSLEELQKKVQRLLQLNLQRCRVVRGKSDISNWLDSKKAQELQMELLEIEQSLKSGSESEKISDITLKIELIQQAIAGQAAEAESLKCNYFSKTNQFYNTTSHQSKHLLKESLRLNSKLAAKFLPRHQSKQEILKCSSTNKQSFKRPGKQFYIPPVSCAKKYQPIRLKMQASSYSMEFCHYQAVPTFPKRPPSSRHIPSSVFSVKTSSYQNQFVDKTNAVKPIDYRELDCTHNKLKSINISFMESSRKKVAKQIAKVPKKQNASKQYCNGFRNSLSGIDYNYGLSVSEQFYKTQQRRQFNSNGIKSMDEAFLSVPKNKQLLKLKENFRLFAQGI